MNCIKCGRETVGEQVFCLDCQAQMEKYPVRPGTVIQLPVRKEAAVIRKAQPKRRAVPLEEQVKYLRRRVTRLTIAFLAVCLITILLAKPAITHLLEDNWKIGQNYHSTTSTEES